MGDEKRVKIRSSKKVRKLYHLDQEDARFVREYAQQKGVSESEIIRVSVRKLQGSLQKDPFAEMIGSVRAGNNQAERHDEVIYE